MRKAIAGMLRAAASALDGRRTIGAAWHRRSVRSMNEYVGRTEGYVYVLEDALEDAGLGPRLEELRRAYGRSAHRFPPGTWPGPDEGADDAPDPPRLPFRQASDEED